MLSVKSVFKNLSTEQVPFRVFLPVGQWVYDTCAP